LKEKTITRHTGKPETWPAGLACNKDSAKRPYGKCIYCSQLETDCQPIREEVKTEVLALMAIARAVASLPEDSFQQLNALRDCSRQWKSIDDRYRYLDNTENGDSKLMELYGNYVKKSSRAGLVNLPPIRGHESSALPPVVQSSVKRRLMKRTSFRTTPPLTTLAGSNSHHYRLNHNIFQVITQATNRQFLPTTRMMHRHYTNRITLPPILHQALPSLHSAPMMLSM
jgi:hypothetical protein